MRSSSPASRRTRGQADDVDGESQVEEDEAGADKVWWNTCVNKNNRKKHLKNGAHKNKKAQYLYMCV